MSTQQSLVASQCGAGTGPAREQQLLSSLLPSGKVRLQMTLELADQPLHGPEPSQEVPEQLRCLASLLLLLLLS